MAYHIYRKGDYHRYLAEFKTRVEHKEATENTLLAYKSARVGFIFHDVLVLIFFYCIYHSILVVQLC